MMVNITNFLDESQNLSVQRGKTLFNIRNTHLDWREMDKTTMITEQNGNSGLHKIDLEERVLRKIIERNYFYYFVVNGYSCCGMQQPPALEALYLCNTTAFKVPLSVNFQLVLQASELTDLTPIAKPVLHYGEILATWH